MTKLDDFVASHLGVATADGDPYGAQCVALVYAWCEALGAPRLWGNAVDMAGQFNLGSRWIPAGDGRRPSPGDVVVWGPTPDLGITSLGHVDIVVDLVNPDSFRGLDQNWIHASLEHGSPAALVMHTYEGVLGWHHFFTLDHQPTPPEEDDDMPVQNWPLPARRFEPGDKAIYVPDVNCNLDDAYISVAGCDEGDGQVEFDVTDGTQRTGPILPPSKIVSFTGQDDGVLRVAAGVVRIVIKNPTAPCWVAVKTQSKGR